MPRRVRIAALALWPGLAQVWTGQEMLGILLGMSFASSLNAAIAGRWIWRDAMPSGWTGSFAAVAIASWVASAGHALWWDRFRHPGRHRAEIDRLLREAHEAYLRGRWGESRARLERLLEMDDSDGDALMQLGALYVRTNQPSLARRTFRRCLESKQGAKWRWEIHRELERLSDGS